MAVKNDELVVMGRIVAPYGILGWVKIQPSTEYLDNLLDYENWHIGKDGTFKAYFVETAKTHVDTLVAKLEGVNDRDAALALKSKQIAVMRSELPEAGEGEYYWSDLVGLSVKNLQDVDFGVITEVFETGANDVLVVRDTSGEKALERLVPFTEQAVLEVDIANKTMRVDWDAEF